MLNKTLPALIAASLFILQVSAQEADRSERFKEMSASAEAKGLAEAFRGIAIDGEIQEGLFPIQSTGVSTAPVQEAADAFIAMLTSDQQARTQYPVDDPEWRKWMNQHFYVRQGVSFKEMNEAQREAAFAMLGAALSARGLQLSQDIMRLDHTLGELRRRGAHQQVILVLGVDGREGGRRGHHGDSGRRRLDRGGARRPRTCLCQDAGGVGSPGTAPPVHPPDGDVAVARARPQPR